MYRTIFMNPLYPTPKCMVEKFFINEGGEKDIASLPWLEVDGEMMKRLVVGGKTAGG